MDYELIVVDDHSTDRTAEIVDAIGARNPRVRCVRSRSDPGFGLAVRAGLDAFTGDAVAVMMADGSDDPEDLVRYHRCWSRAGSACSAPVSLRGARQ